MSAYINRRGLIAGLGIGVLGSSAPVLARQTQLAAPEAIPLWPDTPPGGAISIEEQEVKRSAQAPEGDTAFVHVTRPTLTFCRPALPNGAAIILVPGGGYVRVAVGLGGRALLQAFANAGYHAFLLKYRLPGDPWQAGADAPLQDAQRALRLVRSRAVTDGFDADRIALWGGSAGGHLAARLSNTAAGHYQAVDEADALPLGVKAAILSYPVNLMTGPHVHAGSRKQLMAHVGGAGHAPLPPEQLAAEAGISPATPPTFLVHALDVKVVPVENSLSYFMALRRNAVLSELHVQEHGGHGFGWTRPDGEDWAWPAQALDFIRRHGA